MAYEQVGFSGEQYILEKGVYRNCDDWGSGSCALGSLQPVVQVCAGTKGVSPRGRGRDGGRGQAGKPGLLGKAGRRTGAARRGGDRRVGVALRAETGGLRPM